MRKLIIIILGLFSVAYGQKYQSMPQAGYGPVKRMQFDSVVTLPMGITRLRNLSDGRDSGQVRYNPSDSSLYVYTGSTWVRQGGGGGGNTDTTNLSYRIDTVHSGLSSALSDTAAAIRAAVGGIDAVLAAGNTATNKSLTINDGTSANQLSIDENSLQVQSGADVPTVIDYPKSILNPDGLSIFYGTDSYRSQTKLATQELRYTNADGYYTSVQFTNPTQNNTIEIKNGSGTLAFLSDITGGSNVGDSLVKAYDTLAAHNTRIGALDVGKASLSGATFTGSVGIGTSPDASALFDVSSTTKGVLIPRVTTTQMNAISSPVDGLQVYNTTEKAIYFYNSDWGWESDALSYKRKFGVEYFNELTTATPSDGVIVSTNSSSGAISALSGVASRTGIQSVTTGTSATSRYTLATDATALVLGAGRVLFEESVRIPTLSNATDAFYHFFGLSAQITASAQTNGVLFLYDSSGTVTGAAASGRWQVMTAAASSRTFTTTSIQVTANQWYKLTGIVNAAGTSVQFYIDDVLVATHTTNIPTAAIGFVSNLQKSAGTTARTTNLDYLYFKQKYTTSR